MALLDPALPGDAARIARWDVAARESTGHFRRMPAGDGIYLELPWPNKPPAHGNLQVLVRFTTRDGRHLEAQRPLAIALVGRPPLEAPAAATHPILTPPQLAGSWQARPLPKENDDDDLLTGETPVPLDRSPALSTRLADLPGPVAVTPSRAGRPRAPRNVAHGLRRAAASLDSNVPAGASFEPSGLRPGPPDSRSTRLVAQPAITPACAANSGTGVPPVAPYEPS